MTKETDRVQAEIDKLIDWYRANKPEAGQEILVDVSPKHLDKFARPEVPNVLYAYRGRRLRCVSKRVH